MYVVKRLALRREALTDLTPGDLSRVAGAAPESYSFLQCIDEIVLKALEDLLPPPADTFRAAR